MTLNRVKVSFYNCFENKIDCHWIVSVHLTTVIILVLRSTQNIYENNIILKFGQDSDAAGTLLILLRWGFTDRFVG